MRRYHIKIYWKEDAPQKLNAFTASLNLKAWKYSRHCLDNANVRFLDIEKLLLYIKTLTLDSQTIFEYYELEGGAIEKAVYRIKYTEHLDVVLVINAEKNIVTIYTQDVDDKHFTLDTRPYNKE